MIYLYDGTYYGLLTCVYEHYYTMKANEIYAVQLFGGSLIDETRFITSDEDKAEKVEAAIKDKFSSKGYMDMYRSFLSDEPNKDNYILQYLMAGFKMGAKIDRMYSEPYVIRIRELSRRVGFESHRFLGLLRFVERKPYLYAKFEPDSDILTLIADHFADRYKNERIIIHDLKRQKALIAHGGQWLVYDVENQNQFLDEEENDELENLLQELWKGYFEHIGIEGRRNLKLQQSFVPLKYRKHILEFNSMNK